MRKLISLAFFIFIAGAFRGNAQSLHNTAWKAFFTGPNDTLTLHIGIDSSFVTMSNGDIAARSTIRVSKDTLSLTDFDGQFMCPNSTGVYQFTVSTDKLVMKLISDPCDGRSTAINGVEWSRVKIKENH